MLCALYIVGNTGKGEYIIADSEYTSPSADNYVYYILISYLSYDSLSWLGMLKLKMKVSSFSI